jgi:hypothetical protein
MDACSAMDVSESQGEKATRIAAAVAAEMEPLKRQQIQPNTPAAPSSLAQAFPPDLLLLVLRRLAAVPVHALWAARGACRHWRAVAAASPGLWRDLAVSAFGDDAASVTTLQQYLDYGATHRQPGHGSAAIMEEVFLLAVRKNLCPFSTSGWRLARRHLVARGLSERVGWECCRPPSFGGAYPACKDGVVGHQHPLRHPTSGLVPVPHMRNLMMSHAHALKSAPAGTAGADDEDSDDDDDERGRRHAELYAWLRSDFPEDQRATSPPG